MTSVYTCHNIVLHLLVTTLVNNVLFNVYIGMLMNTHC